MATVNFSIPEDIKNRFNEIFANQNKSHIIANLMRQAINEYEHQKQRAQAIDALLKLRAKQKPVSKRAVQSARKLGRP